MLLSSLWLLLLRLLYIHLTLHFLNLLCVLYFFSEQWLFLFTLQQASIPVLTMKLHAASILRGLTRAQHHSVRCITQIIQQSLATASLNTIYARCTHVSPYRLGSGSDPSSTPWRPRVREYSLDQHHHRVPRIYWISTALHIHRQVSKSAVLLWTLTHTAKLPRLGDKISNPSHHSDPLQGWMTDFKLEYSQRWPRAMSKYTHH